MTQQTIFDTYKLNKVEGISKLPIKQAFLAFHRANPWVVIELEKVANEMIKHGHNKLGVQQLIEVFRWETRRHTISKDFKINNNFAAHYARLLMDRNPHWGQIFELRKIRSN